MKTDGAVIDLNRKQARVAGAELAAALVAFAGEITDPKKGETATIQPRDSSKAPFGFPYADLSSIVEHVRPVLAKHGLTALQDVTSSETSVAVPWIEVQTIIVHTSGQIMTFGPLRLPSVAGDNKATGGSITSARRFALMAALGIAATTDENDGKGKNGGARKPGGLATSRQQAKIAAEAERGKISDEELAKVLTTFSAATTAELTVQQASKMIERLCVEVDRRLAAKQAGADPVTGEVHEPSVDPDDGRDFWPGADPDTGEVAP